MKKLLLFLCLACVCSSAYARRVATKMSKLERGMTIEQVVKILGKPESVSKNGDKLYYNYLDQRTDAMLSQMYQTWYYVRFINDKVESFGQKGDFDSSKDRNGGLNLNISSDGPKDDPTQQAETDEVVKLRKLKAMLDEGLITEEEYNNSKRSVLESLTK